MENDEQLYLRATVEFDDGHKDESLWSKAIAQAEGDQEKARYKYIKMRVEQLKEIKRKWEQEQQLDEAKIIGGLASLGYVMSPRMFGGWKITEPLGGIVKVKTLEEANDYYRDVLPVSTPPVQHSAKSEKEIRKEAIDPEDTEEEYDLTDGEAMEILDTLMESGKKWVSQGEAIAEDCLINGLRKGEVVKLSDMETYIEKEYTYNTSAVLNGFLQKMQTYIKNGEVENFVIEGGQMLFVHKDHSDKIIN